MQMQGSHAVCIVLPPDIGWWFSSNLGDSTKTLPFPVIIHVCCHVSHYKRLNNFIPAAGGVTTLNGFSSPVSFPFIFTLFHVFTTSTQVAPSATRPVVSQFDWMSCGMSVCVCVCVHLGTGLVWTMVSLCTSQMCIFSLELSVYCLVGVCDRVHACVILIWVLFISFGKEVHLACLATMFH